MTQFSQQYYVISNQFVSRAAGSFLIEIGMNRATNGVAPGISL